MKLSIIIPVYNVEQYVEKCLRNCASQDISSSDYEIIVVNDGTKDKSLQIAEQVALDFENITIISQANAGLSAARNSGLRIAKGDYIWFVDSDDWIEPNCLGEITAKLKDDLDLLQIQYRLVFDNGATKDVDSCIIDGIKDGPSQMINRPLPAPVPFTLYRRKFLEEHDLHFVKGIYHEDSEFKPRATFLARKIASVPQVCYNYYQRTNGSITSHFRLKNGIDMIRVMNNLFAFSRSHDMPLDCLRAFNRCIGLDMNSLLLGYRSLDNRERQQIRDLLKRNKHLFRAMIYSCQSKYMLEGLTFFISIRFGLSLHRLLR